ncbi:MAG TPA: hypothetical protein VIF62_36510, partial [Labilithrix sp.]
MESARSRLFRNRAAAVGLAIVVVIALFAIFGPLVVGTDPFTSDFSHGISPEKLPIGPGGVHLLGTDRIFRDQLARLALGGRVSLF